MRPGRAGGRAGGLLEQMPYYAYGIEFRHQNRCLGGLRRQDERGWKRYGDDGADDSETETQVKPFSCGAGMKGTGGYVSPVAAP